VIEPIRFYCVSSILGRVDMMTASMLDRASRLGLSIDEDIVFSWMLGKLASGEYNRIRYTQVYEVKQELAAALSPRDLRL
jgi:hypothetical protein